MTREQILARLEQEYARRREDNLRLFEQRREEACGAVRAFGNCWTSATPR